MLCVSFFGWVFLFTSFFSKFTRENFFLCIFVFERSKRKKSFFYTIFTLKREKHTNRSLIVVCAFQGFCARQRIAMQRVTLWVNRVEGKSGGKKWLRWWEGQESGGQANLARNSQRKGTFSYTGSLLGKKKSSSSRSVSSWVL